MNNVQLNLGKGIVVTVDKDRLSPYPAIMTHAINMGLKNILKDSHASYTKKDFPDTYKQLSRGIVDRKLTALYNGELRVNTPSMSVEDVKAAMTTDELEAELARRKKAEKTAKAA